MVTEQATEQAEALVSGGPFLVWTGSEDLHGPVLGLPRGGYIASVGRLWGPAHVPAQCLLAFTLEPICLQPGWVWGTCPFPSW